MMTGKNAHVHRTWEATQGLDPCYEGISCEYKGAVGHRSAMGNGVQQKKIDCSKDEEAPRVVRRKNDRGNDDNQETHIEAANGSDDGGKRDCHDGCKLVLGDCKMMGDLGLEKHDGDVPSLGLSRHHVLD